MSENINNWNNYVCTCHNDKDRLEAMGYCPVCLLRTREELRDQLAAQSAEIGKLRRVVTEVRIWHKAEHADTVQDARERMEEALAALEQP